MKILTSTELLSFSNAPTRPERLLEDKRARIERLTSDPASELIPCPGGCGAMALLESPMLVMKAGQTATVRVAQCTGTCKTEIKVGRLGKIKLVPARFDLPCEHELEGTPMGPEADGPAEQIKRAMKHSGLTQVVTAAKIGCSQSAISKMLNGKPVTEKTLTAALTWAKEALGVGLKSFETSTKAKKVEAEAESTALPAQAFEVVQAAPESEQVPDIKPTVIECATTVEPEPATLAYEADVENVTVEDCWESVEPTVEDIPYTSKEVSRIEETAARPNPYEAVLRAALEEVARHRLEEIAGPVASNFVVRISLEWSDNP